MATNAIQPPQSKTSLGNFLDQLTRPGELYEKLDDNKVRCYACGHRCLIRPGRRGICQVRFNKDGVLYVPWGYVAALQVDPIEKKPFYHVWPGHDALTFGMLGCDYHCPYCQNWLTSQALRDPVSDAHIRYVHRVEPEDLVRMALEQGAKAVISSYNEPLITSEWAMAIFRPAKQAELITGYVSNGNATREVLEYIRPHTDAYKIDLKTMNDKNYRRLGGVLQRVLDTIRMTHEMGFWVEVVTLVVPGFNDSEDELREAARFIASVSKDIPWHVTAFHPDYKMTDPPPTRVNQLIRAAEIGKEEGLNFVYAGNLPGRVGPFEHTWCPKCGELLIRRYGYIVQEYHLTPQGTCPRCGTRIPGLWPKRPEDVRLHGPGLPRPLA
ncbi:MAG: AmmeMemoRadiSam system radical SAM enzyme [Chloroflexi bacterium]|nr:AmmeMemoRadiSam system radical SAM enzyme [Chloroflexota bacterium]